jgi:hypothetical protein
MKALETSVIIATKDFHRRHEKFLNHFVLMLRIWAELVCFPSARNRVARVVSQSRLSLSVSLKSCVSRTILKACFAVLWVKSWQSSHRGVCFRTRCGWTRAFEKSSSYFKEMCFDKTAAGVSAVPVNELRMESTAMLVGEDARWRLVEANTWRPTV